MQNKSSLHFYGIDYNSICIIANKLLNYYHCIGSFNIENGELIIKVEASNNYDVKQVQQSIINKTKCCFIGYGNDNSSILEDKVGKNLIRHNLSITSAESLTAGKFQSLLGSVSGISQVFTGGFVTYSADVKHKLLNIPYTIINRNGVVSMSTAIWMAKQSRNILNANIGVSFTGVAGPDSLEGHPAGTVWIGISTKKGNFAKKYIFKPFALKNNLNNNQKRNNIRLFSAKMGFKMVQNYLNQN